MTTRALDTFSTVIFRGLAVLRALVAAFTISYVGIWWHDWYGEHPARLIGPALVLAWCLVYVAVTARGAPSRAIVYVDIAIGITVGLTARWTVARPSLGDPSSWVWLTVMFAGLSAACALRTRFSLVALLLLAGAHLAPAFNQRPQVLTSTALLLFVGITVREAVVLLQRVALGADEWLDAVGARSRAELVAETRAKATRASERFLHDTVLNTLAGIGLGGVARAPGGGAGTDRPSAGAASADAMSAGMASAGMLPGGMVSGDFGDVVPADVALVRARARCGRVVAQVEELLMSSGGAEDAHGDSDAELARQVRAVVEEAADDGLAVTVSHTRVGERRWSRTSLRPRGTQQALRGAEPLPAEVVTALAAALREALTNVRRHAGVAAARVSIVRWLDAVCVEIGDDGVGFDAASYDPPAARAAAAGAGLAGSTPVVTPVVAGDETEAHLGISGSVHGRMADVGGWARIASAPGQGTRVELDWQATRPVAVGSADSDDLRRDYEQASRRGVGIAIIVGIALLGVPAVLFRKHSHPSLGLLAPMASYASILLWLIVAAGAVSLIFLICHRALSGAEALGALAFTVAVVLAGATITTGGEVIRIYNWAGILVSPLLLLPITVSRPTRQWAAAVVVVIAVTLAVSVPRIGSAPLDLVRMLGILYGITTIQLLATVAGPVLRATAQTTTEAARGEAELGANQEAAAVVRRDRARRLARLDHDVLPLLRAVADGSADPRDDRIRRLCASRARALRRMLSGSGGHAGPLAELETAIDAAEARGAMITLQIDGDLAEIPGDVREALVDLLSETLRVTPPGRVMMTLLCAGSTGEGYVSYPAVVSPGAGRWPWTCALVTGADLDEGNMIVELSWPPAPRPALAGSLAR